MIEPNSWDLNEVKVQPSPLTPYNFYMKISRLSSLVSRLYTFVPLKYQMLTSVMPKQFLSRLSVYAFVV